MYYEFEWLSDLAIIPAWECFLAGLLLGMVIVLAIKAITEGRK